MGRCAFLEYFYGCGWVVVTVQSIFMCWCTFLEYIYGWVLVFATVQTKFVWWVWLFRAFLWVGVTGCGWVSKIVWSHSYHSSPPMYFKNPPFLSSFSNKKMVMRLARCRYLRSFKCSFQGAFQTMLIYFSKDWLN